MRTNIGKLHWAKRRGGILLCPDSPPGDDELSYSANSQVIGLISSDTSLGENFYQSTVPMSQVADPANIVLLGDAIPGFPTDSGNLNTRAADEYSYPHPALIKDHTNDVTWAERTGWYP